MSDSSLDKTRDGATVSGAASGSPISEAIRCLSKQRTQLVEKRNELLESAIWRRFDEFWKIHTEEIAEIDHRLDALIAAANNDCPTGGKDIKKG